MDPLVERDLELAAVATAIAATADGRGAVLLFEGEAGIGKTSLLGAARGAARAAGLTLGDARASATEAGVAFGVVRQLLLPVLGDDRAQLLRGAAALAAPALDGGAPPAASTPDGGFATIHGLVWLVNAVVAERGPLVLVADDVHWADPASLRVLAALAARVQELPLLLVLGARPPASASDPAALAPLRGVADVLRPRRLSAEGVGALLAARLGAAPSERLTAEAHRQTAGSPFLASALATAVARAGLAPDDAAAPQIAALGIEQVEPRVRARLHELPPAATTLAAAIAVLGDGRAAAEATALAGLPAAAADSAAVALEEAGLVVAWPRPGYVHPLVRSAVLDGLDAGAAGALHAAAARQASAAGEPERAGAHLLETTGAGDPVVVATLVDAAGRASARGAPDMAAVLLRRALAEPPADELQSTVLLALGAAELAIGDPRAPDRLAVAAAAAGPPELRAQAGAMLGIALSFAGRWAEGLAAMDAAAAAARDVAPELHRVARLHGAAIMMSSHGTAREALARLAALEAESSGGERALDTDTLGVLALRDAWTGAPREETIAQALRALRHAGAPSLPPLLQGLPMIALVLVDAYAHADAALAQAVDRARDQGDIANVRILSAWQALGRCRASALHEADEALLGVADGDGPPPPIAAVIAAATHGLVALARGDVAAAVAAAAVPLDRDPALADTTFCDLLLAVRAAARLAGGDAPGALTLFEHVGTRQAQLSGASVPLSQWRTGAALAACAAATRIAGRDLAECEVAEARRFGAPRPLAAALRALALATGDEAPLLEGIAILDGEPAAVERAALQLDLGAALLRAGRPDAARDPLRAALDGAWRCGADGLAERARADLLAAGGRPRRSGLTGAAALTAAEARTARIAAAGAGNREIAQRLFVTEKTVETHLTATYRKLGIGGRAELASALAVGLRGDIAASG